MTYWIIAIIFFVISAALLIYSFFIEDDTAGIQEEVEEITLDVYQDMSHIRERLDIIEEQLNINTADRPIKDRVTNITENQIIKLYTRGKSSEGIAEDVGLPADVIISVINDHISEGEVKER